MAAHDTKSPTEASQSAQADFVWSLQRIHSPVQSRGRLIPPARTAARTPSKGG
jgi:hypothetical protein